jgi:hypothetical protein
MLNSFHLLTLQGKTSAYDFYLSIARKSDNTGTVDVKVYLILIPVLTFTDTFNSINMNSS